MHDLCNKVISKMNWYRHMTGLVITSWLLNRCWLWRNPNDNRDSFDFTVVLQYYLCLSVFMDQKYLLKAAISSLKLDEIVDLLFRNSDKAIPDEPGGDENPATFAFWLLSDGYLWTWIYTFLLENTFTLLRNTLGIEYSEWYSEFW